MASQGNPFGVQVEGYRELRRDLRAIDRDLDKEMRAGLKQGVERVALPTARALTPRRTGRLAGSLRVRATGNKVAITSRLPYSNVQHWGGTTGPGHERGPNRGSVHVRPALFAKRAIEERAEQIVDAVGDSLEALAKRHGWH